MSDQQPPQPPQQPPGWGSQQLPTQPPGWGPPPQPPARKRHTARNVILVVVGVLVVLGIIGALAGDPTTTGTGASGTATTAAPGQPQETAAPETTARGGPAMAKVGQTLQFEDGFGERSADVTVARKKVSTGSAFDQPNGVYVGLFVQVKGYQDGISVPGFYVLAGGKRYESTIAGSGFEPSLISFEVNKGETAEGWLVFDLPSRSGRFVMEEFASDEPQAIWTF